MDTHGMQNGMQTKKHLTSPSKTEHEFVGDMSAIMFLPISVEVILHSTYDLWLIYFKFHQLCLMTILIKLKEQEPVSSFYTLFQTTKTFRDLDMSDSTLPEQLLHEINALRFRVRN